MANPLPFKTRTKGNHVAHDNAYANNNGFYIEIFPVHAAKKVATSSEDGDLDATSAVRFKAYLTQFDDQYSADFSPESVFGRMDAIQVYRGTTRNISLSWDVPSSNHEEAAENLKKCSRLMSYMYPVYQTLGEQNQSGKILTSPPLFRVKFANLITNTSGDAGGSIGGTAEEHGLLGTIQGFTYSPDLDSGFFTSLETGMKGDLLPQTISLSCEFSVIHDHALGFDSGGKKAQGTFPYGQKDSGPTQNFQSPGTNVNNSVADRKEQADNQKSLENN